MKETKIKFYGLEEWMMNKIFKEGLSSRQIADRALLEKGVTISFSSIEAFKRSVLQNAKEFMAGGKEEYRSRLAEIYLDTVENLVRSMQEIQNKLDEYRDSVTYDEEGNAKKDWQAHSRYLELNLRLLYMLLKRAKEIGPDVQVIKNTMNVVQMNSVIQEKIIPFIDYLLSKGVSIEQLPPEYLEFYKKMKAHA